MSGPKPQQDQQEDPQQNEEARLRELYALDLLDTASEADFDHIVELASIITGCPISLISLIDRRRQWFKAKIGLDADETARDISFCTHAIEDDALYVIGDAMTDERFSGNPLVVGDPKIRFYAGHPLVTSNGFRIGTLCTIDRVPRELSADQIRQLALLASQAVRMMELRLSNKLLRVTEGRLKDAIREVSSAREIAQNERLKFEEALEQTRVPVALFEGPDHRYAFANSEYQKVFGFDRSPVGHTITEMLPDAVEQGFGEILNKVYSTGETIAAKAAPFDHLQKNGTIRRMYNDFTCTAKRSASNVIEGVLTAVVEVTDQIELQRALEGAKQDLVIERDKLERIFASTPAPMALFRGEDLIIDTYNAAYASALSGRKLAGRALLEAVPEFAEQDIPRLLLEVLRTGQPHHATDSLTQIADPETGEIRDTYYSFSFVPIVDPSGRAEAVLSHAIETTESVLSRKRLEVSEARVRHYAEAMPQMAFIADAHGDIYYFNRRFYDYVGLPIGAAKGSDWVNYPIHHPDDLARTIERWKRSVKTGEPYEIEYRLRRGDGEYRWHLGRAIAERDSNGQIREWFGTNTDIHDLREAEADRRSAEEALNLALTSADIGFWDWDARTGHTTLSDTLMASWGIDPKTYNHTLDECLERIHPSDRDRVWAEIQTSTFQKRRYDVEYRVIRPDGQILVINAKGEFFLNERGEPKRLTGVAIDITARKRAEQEILDARIAADAASAAKSAFLANMSHEIRTPLGAIMGFSELAQQTGSLSDEAGGYLNVIQRNSVQVLKIVDDILDLAKVEAGKVLIEKIETPLISFLADFSSLMGFRARENGIAFRVEALSDLPDSVLMDPTRVRQVLTNAVGNAIKFTSHGSVSLHVCYRNGSLEFNVRDTGRGISPDQASSLFQAFVQADISTTRKYGGTGLGLVLTKRLCQTMGGDYVLKHSQIGVGSHFIATVAIETSSHSRMLKQNEIVFRASSDDKSVKTMLGSPLAGLRILVVEDSPDNQELLRVILEKQGVLFSLANNGAEGVERAMEETFDVVLMDVQMPVMDGHEAVATLRAKGYRGPVIALTAHAMKEEYERAMRSGFTDYLSKPIQRAELSTMIAKHSGARIS